MTGKKPIVVVGSINIDLVANTERIPVAGETVTGLDFDTHHGGKGANQAVAAGRLGYPVRMIGRVGSDAFGEQLRTGLMNAGVDAAGVAASEGSSGVAIIVVARNGENSIVVVPGANGLLTPQDLDAHVEMIRTAGVVLAQLEIPMETVEHLAAICEREGVPLILDPAPARELSPELLARVAWFTPNETEAAFFAGAAAGTASVAPEDVARMLKEKGVENVALKLGSRGAFITSAREVGAQVDSFPVQAIDTTAAGDCFNGAFAVGLMQGMSPEDAARYAAAAAAISVTRRGAQPSMPSRTEVESMLAGSWKPA